MKQTIKKMIQSGGKSAVLIAVGFALAAGTAVLAYTAPTSTAPNGNVAAPINTGSVTQVKAGDIGLVNLIASGTATAAQFKSERTTVPGNASSCNGNWVCLLSIAAQNSPMLDIANSATKKGIKIDGAGNAYYFDGVNSPSNTPFPTIYRTLYFDNTGKLDSGPAQYLAPGQTSGQVLTWNGTNWTAGPGPIKPQTIYTEDKQVVTDTDIKYVKWAGGGANDQNGHTVTCPSGYTAIAASCDAAGGSGAVSICQVVIPDDPSSPTTYSSNSANTGGYAVRNPTQVVVRGTANNSFHVTATCMKVQRETVKVVVDTPTQPQWHILNYGNLGTVNGDCRTFAQSLAPQYDGSWDNIAVQSFMGTLKPKYCLMEGDTLIGPNQATLAGKKPSTGNNVTSPALMVKY